MLHLRGILGCVHPLPQLAPQQIFTKQLLCAGTSLVADNIAMNEADSGPALRNFTGKAEESAQIHDGMHRNTAR